jgi:uncharacterized protein
MKLHQSISHLTGKEQNDLRHIAKAITTSLQPPLVFCYGSRLTQQIRRSCFLQKKRNESSDAVYDLLIILDDNETLQESTAATVLQRIVGEGVKTTVLVYRLSYVKEQLMEGSFFFSWIHRSAILLINRNNVFTQLPPQRKKTETVAMFTETYNEIKRCLDNAKLLLAEANDRWALQPYAVTLQLIRNAAKEVIKAFIYTGLGYNANDLSLEAMMILSENFSIVIPGLFPRNTPEEDHLYLLLTDKVTLTNLQPQTLLILFGRIKELKQKVNDYLFKNGTLLKYTER